MERCLAWLGGTAPHTVLTPNAEILALAHADPELRSILNGADLVVPDGAGVVVGSRMLGDPVPERVPGVELADRLLRTAPPGTRVFLLGAAREAVQAATLRFGELYPHIVLAGYHHGFWPHFDPQADRAVVGAVRHARPAILFAGLGAPKQERWLHQYKADLGVPIAMGIGGGIDLWAGRATRAPLWMRQANLEWLYRIVKFGRYGRSLPLLARFAGLVVAERLRQRARR